MKDYLSIGRLSWVLCLVRVNRPSYSNLFIENQIVRNKLVKQND